jgi:hypothetical protein
MPDLVSLSKIEKARAIVRLLEAGNETDAYLAMGWMLREREWPDWLKEACASVDTLTTKEAA